MSFGRRLLSLNAYDRHKLLINEYVLCKKGAAEKLQRDTSKDKRDIDVIRENHRFLWTEENPESWEEELAKKYYDKLFKEYCICDLSRYKENKVALRWRVEGEVVEGKGQFECGTKTCTARDDLRTWEVNFSYRERGEKHNALVKLRLCPPCSEKLNYHHKKREVKRNKKRKVGSKEGGGEESKKARKESKSTPTPTEVPVEGEGAVAGEQSKTTPDEAQVWREAGTAPEEKSRDEEFQEYLEDLFL